MKQIKKILFVFDENTTSVPIFNKAIQLAKNNNAHLGVVAVESKPPFELRILKPPVPVQQMEKLLTEERLKQMNEFVSPARTEGVSVDKKVLQGTPFIELIREILREHYNLVIVAAEGKERVKEMFFGSTTMHLMRKSPCPVWAIKKTQKRSLNQILAAVDPVDEDEPDGTVRNQLNNKIMDLATSLALQEKSQLHVIHVWSLFGEDFMRYRAGVPNQEVDLLTGKTKKLHRERIHQLLNPYHASLPNIQLHFLKGDPWRVIPEFSKREGIDLLVMGTVARSGISGLLMGNTAEKILHQVNCSVLAVKPDGFVSPVKLED